jgi:hypothetical protein
MLIVTKSVKFVLCLLFINSADCGSSTFDPGFFSIYDNVLILCVRWWDVDFGTSLSGETVKELIEWSTNPWVESPWNSQNFGTLFRLKIFGNLTQKQTIYHFITNLLDSGCSQIHVFRRANNLDQVTLVVTLWHNNAACILLFQFAQVRSFLALKGSTMKSFMFTNVFSV